MSDKKTAAFFRLEGTLVRQSVLDLSAYLAANGHGFIERASRLGRLAIAAPFYGFLGQSDRNLATRIATVPLRGMSEDRVAVLADEYFNDVLKERLLQDGITLVKQAKEAGHRIILISDMIGPVAQQIADHLEIVDELVCNQLEFVDGAATGKLLDPVIGGHQLGPWVTAHATTHDIDLSQSTAYATHGPDLLLLAAVGLPCAVNPDITLRRAAQEARWPVMELTV